MRKGMKTKRKPCVTALATLIIVLSSFAAEFRVPAHDYMPQIRDGIAILPGGRVLRPYGKQVLTGTGPFAIAVSPSGKTIVSANVGISSATGINRPSLTVIIPGRNDTPWNLTDLAAEPEQPRNRGWQGLTTGLAVVSDGSAWVTEGDTGRIVEVSLSSGGRKASIDLNSGEFRGSFSDRLALDAPSGLMLTLDRANFRAVLANLKHSTLLSSVKTPNVPVAAAFAPDAKRMYVVSAAYLGDNPKPATLSVFDIVDTTAPKLAFEVPLGGSSDQTPAGVAPAGILIHGDDVYVTLSNSDSVVVVNGSTGKLEGEIPLRIPGLEAYRGITPLGMAFDQKSGRLLVTEAGINAVAVIDPESRRVLGHLPVGWFPTAIAVHDGQIYVANSKGLGTGPSTPPQLFRFWGSRPQSQPSEDTGPTVLRRGTVSAFVVPGADDLARQTDMVMEANGFHATGPIIRRKPPVRSVVLIVRGNRSFDDVFGDIDHAGGLRVFAEPMYARYGLDGYIAGGKHRFSLRVPVTPNLHKMGGKWSIADNFYADSDSPTAAERWLTGNYPGWSSETGSFYQEAGNGKFLPKEKPSPGPLWEHLSRHGVDFLNFTLPASSGTSDYRRADQFIAKLRKEYLEPGKALPPFVWLSLPNDVPGPARPNDGYPYEASYIADNDYAVGQVLQFLSRSPWWHDMAVFVTEAGAGGGPDHVDSHRIPLLGVGPWFRSNYVSHTNASFPSLLRTVFGLLSLPPMTLYDATASDLSDMFANVPDFGTYDVAPEDSRLWNPANVK